MPSNPTTLARLARFAAHGVLAPARAVQARIAARLDAQDVAGRAHGWTVEPTRAGGRVYRDPRFDQLADRTTASAAVGTEVCS